MAFNTSALISDMLRAAEGVLKKEWPEVREYAETEFKKLSETLLLIERLKAEKKITKKQADLHIQIWKNTARMVLLTLEGLGIIAVENAINAALKVVRDTVNTAIGWKLL